jgi:hypothetical protein
MSTFLVFIPEVAAAQSNTSSSASSVCMYVYADYVEETVMTKMLQ